MVRSAIFLAAVVAADDRCCYEGCSTKPTSCNSVGDYCNSAATCGSCGGTWCPDSPSPTPTPPPPTPSPPPTPGAAYCPTASDLLVAYGEGVQIEDGGWSIQGDGGAATKASFNLLGGFVEFDFDVSNANTGVIPNVYTVSPDGIDGGFTSDKYCDDGENDKPDCLEVDWLEANGGCGGATTLHTVSGTGPGACNYWGCRSTYSFGGATFHMKVEYGSDGRFTITRDGQQISGDSLDPPASGQDWGIVQSTYQSKGGVIYSSQWTGSWVPADFCGGGPGDLDGSQFRISNLRISGSVVQGPEPSKCGSLFSNTTAVMI